MKKTIVNINGLKVIGEIDEDLVEEYIAITIPLGVSVIIGNDINDVIKQISITLRQQGNRDLECNDKENFDACVKRVKGD